MMKKKVHILILAVLLQPALLGQTGSVNDKYTLLTKPFIDRPLNLYRGQIQFNTGYEFLLRSRSFDNVGEVIDLKKMGNSSVTHRYNLELRYGLFDFFEVGIETGYSKKGIRLESISNGTSSSEVIVNTLNRYTGLEDLLIRFSLSPPLKMKNFDIRVSGGMFLNTAEHEPDKPSHIITDYYNNNNSYTINYRNNYRNGSGVPVLYIASEMKLKFSRFMAFASFSLKDPVREGESIRWNYSLSGSTFIYESQSFSYIPDRITHLRFLLHYQPTGWFNVFVGGSRTAGFGGWTEYWDLKYGNPETKLTVLHPGYEIQVSPAVRISQQIGYTISGQNTDAPFFLITSMSFNGFLFRK